MEPINISLAIAIVGLLAMAALILGLFRKVMTRDSLRYHSLYSVSTYDNVVFHM